LKTFADSLISLARLKLALVGDDVRSRPRIPTSSPCRLLTLIVVIFCVLLAVSAPAGELVVGDAVPPFAAKDQFGKEFKLEPGLHCLMLGFDMNASKEANVKLSELGAGWLEKTNAAYVLDIHTMPAVARFFALPKMRKYLQRIVLGDDAAMLAPFPRQAGMWPGPPHTESYIKLAASATGFTSDLPVLLFHNLAGGTLSSTADAQNQNVILMVFEPVNGRTSLNNPPTLVTRAGLNIRGSTSAGFPQSPFALEIWDEYNQDRKVGFLGMPEDSDWVLYGQSPYDPSYLHSITPSLPARMTTTHSSSSS